MSKPPTFRQTVGNIPNLADQWKPGLGALRSEDKPNIAPADPRRFRGSVDIDTALRKLQEHSQANRWDFAVGFQHSNRKNEFVYWIEIHTGSDSQISVVLRKLEWLRHWLVGEGAPLAGFECEFVWVPSGATKFTKRSRQVKALAGKGLHYSGTVFKIPDAHPSQER